MSSKLISSYLLLLLLVIFGAGYLHGALVHKLPMQVSQPDGKVLDLFASGDEYHNWLHDGDNFTIIADPQTGWYCYAEKSGDEVIASPWIVGQSDPRAQGLTPGINISPALYKQLRQARFYRPAERDAPTTGTINNIVIYIRFSDETEFGQLISVYDGWFNNSTSSQKNYFLEASYNQLTVNTSFYPPALNNYVVSWQDSHPRAYYQPYSSTNPTGYDGDTERRNREFTLLQNATNGVSAQIPGNLVIDSDGDGRVDNVVYIVKGSAGAWSSLLWPHRWSLYDRYVYINGKRVYDFNFQLQNFLASRGVGVICHEFFHTLGAPDLYHYTDDGIDPAGSWDIMQSDQNPPQHMTAFMKYKYGDWIASIPTITADQAYTLNPLTSLTGNAYRINSQDPSQYYIVEFRKKTGTFENSLPGSGLLVYRIDTTAGNGNADGPPDELYIYRPNGTTTVNGTINSANFSSETGRIKINATTNPAPFLRDGTMGNLDLCEIGSSAGTTMIFRKGPPSIDFTINPYVQGFDATYFPPDGWTNTAESGTYTFTRVTSGTNPSCSPQSGAGMIRYNSDLAPAGNSALFVTPRIVCSDAANHGYQVSFWMYRDGNLSSMQDKIEIYLNSSPGLSGTPDLLGTVHRCRLLAPPASVPGWYQYTFALPFASPGDYYVVFRAVSAGGYNMHLDSIKLARVPLPATGPVPADLAARVPLSPQFSWLAAGGTPSGYKFYLGTDNPPGNLLNGIDLGDVTSYTPASELLSLSGYYWKVVPYNAGGSANSCPVWTFTTLPATDLMVTALQGQSYGLAGTNLDFQITVQNNGWSTLESYAVKLMSDDGRSELASLLVNTPLAMNSSATHTLSWMPSQAGAPLVFGKVETAGDQDASNDASEIRVVHVYPGSSLVSLIGDPDTTLTANSLPFNFYWKNSVSESVYLASELQLGAGTIAGIVYKNNFTQDLAEKPVKIWLKNTVSSNVSSSWLPFTDYVLVFEGTVDFPLGVNSIFIPLDTPFQYTGASLAVRCNRPMDTAYFNSTNHFYLTSSPEYPGRSRYLYSDSVTYDPTAPSGPGTLSDNIPLVSFIIVDPVLLSLPTPAVSIDWVDGFVNLSWEAQPGYFGYDIYETDDPEAWPATATATVFTPAYSVIDDAERKFFKVVAFSSNRGSGLSSPALKAPGLNLNVQRHAPATGSTANKD